MTRTLLCIACIGTVVIPAVRAQVQGYRPVTAAELANPSPNDWLSFSRTYDDQRFSPLNQITRQNVGQLRMAWSRGTPAGTVESTPLVRGGTMYIMTATGGVMALNATNGDLLWEYTRPQPPAPAAPAAGAAGGGRGAAPAAGGRGAPARVYNSRSKTFSIFDDLIFYTAPDSNVVGLDARTGELRWQSKVDTRGNSSGTIM
ncbi:MAG TPA: PQQ-binding-like beta-propeller repeat protein, partial [Bryobacteraceae bacterium]|nr:PQQ-binding-like beta-propeller repeat protein [Bryobacteraceae bacterium]